MRDLLVTALVFGSIPFIFRQPYIGILVWFWLSYMNPHRLAWGFASDFPFAQVIAIVLIVATLMSKEMKKIPMNPLVVVWGLFIVWMGLTTVFAFYPHFAILEYERVIKIQLLIFFALMLVRTKERIILMMWVTVVSLGFYGIKGGIFTILTGGGARVWGPWGSFVEDNNALALAILMILPLMNFLRVESKRRWVRWGLLGAMGLCAISALGSQSRGALLGAW